MDMISYFISNVNIFVKEYKFMFSYNFVV